MVILCPALHLQSMSVADAVEGCDVVVRIEDVLLLRHAVGLALACQGELNAVVVMNQPHSARMLARGFPEFLLLLRVEL